MAFLAGCAANGLSQQSVVPNSGEQTEMRVGPVGASPVHHGHCRAWSKGTGILDDGDFSDAQNPPGAHNTFYKGQHFAEGWTATRGSIDLQSYGSDAKPPGHVCSVDLDGWTVGAIDHAPIATTGGASYTVTFLLSGNGRSNCPSDEPAIKTVSVRAANQAKRFTWDISGGNDAEHGHFGTETWTFKAKGEKTKVGFISLDGTRKNRNFPCGPVVAAISVSEN
jgi:hypothetical protein